MLSRLPGIGPDSHWLLVDLPGWEVMGCWSWGLTGGIASGKSTTADFLKEQGFLVLDADQYARDVASPGTSGWQEIWEAFGSGILSSQW